MPENSEYYVVTFCPHCGTKGHAKFGQTIINNDLRWYYSISCPLSGNIEEDGLGRPPDQLRIELLEAKGTWSICVNSAARMRVLQIVKQTLSLTHSEALTFLYDFPILWAGTKAEADWLVMVFAAGGIDAETWTVDFNLREPTKQEIPDTQSAQILLIENHINLTNVQKVSHFSDGSMSIILNDDGALSHLGIEFDPDRTLSIANAFFALGVPVKRVQVRQNFSGDTAE